MVKYDPRLTLTYLWQAGQIRFIMHFNGANLAILLVWGSPVQQANQYMVKSFKLLLLWNRNANDMGLRSGSWQVCSNDPRLTLIYFTVRSNLFTNELKWEYSWKMIFNDWSSQLLYMYLLEMFNLMRQLSKGTLKWLPSAYLIPKPSSPRKTGKWPWVLVFR